MKQPVFFFLGIAVIGWPFAAAVTADLPHNVPERSIFFDRPSAGDRPGEEQPTPRPEWVLPAPVLSPEEALKSFRLPPGYRIEMVASEPLIHDPIALDFDPDGRIWVVEMRGYMNDVLGSNRMDPVGRVVVLEDTTGDGRMDKSTVFLDGLVLPRAVRVVSDGVLVAEPPYVWLARDLNGDGRADEKIAVVDDYGFREGSPSRGPNGLLRGLDNWLHSAMYGARLRKIDGTWVRDPVPVLGDWGIAMDDYGRIYMNGSSGPIRANFVSSHYYLRNPHYDSTGGVYEVITTREEMEVWPARPTPGVNRGYMPGHLRPDGTLVRYTACGGMTIYRGDRLPELKGNHFLPEPAANLVRRSVIYEDPNGGVTAANPHFESEFLASLDERFRPVNTATAPDGTLYIVDMYRGLFEAHLFVTTYLKRQVFERDLDRPLGLGRIYRVVHESMPPGPAPRLSGARAQELVAHLEHPNGWWRDTAQRLLVERGDRSIAPALRRLARDASETATRLHALWTLEGLGVLEPADVLHAMRRDPDSKVRAAAVRLSEPWLAAGTDRRLIAAVVAALADPAEDVRLQLAFSAGELSGPEGNALAVTLLREHAGRSYITDAVISGLKGRELEVLESFSEALLQAPPDPARERALRALASAVFREGLPQRVDRLLAAAAQERCPAWQRQALLGAVTRNVVLSGPVAIPAALGDSTDARTRQLAAQLEERLVWAGKAGAAPVHAGDAALDVRALQEQGGANYALYCLPCHQANGRGMPDLAPSLVGARWVMGSEELLTKIVLLGKETGSSIMPPWRNVLDDYQIASILTYIRRSWGNPGQPVLPEAVGRVRKETANASAAMTEASLEQELSK